MPVRYHIEEERELIRMRATGYVTWEEVTDDLRQLEVDSRFRRRLDLLLVLTDCTSLPERTQVESLATQIKRLGGRRRFRHCAIVAIQPAMFGMARMFEVLAEDEFVATRIFPTEAEGEAWLSSGGGPDRGEEGATFGD